MLGKTLLNLDQVGRTLDPDFDPNAAIRRNAAELMRRAVRKSLSPGNLFAGVDGDEGVRGAPAPPRQPHPRHAWPATRSR